MQEEGTGLEEGHAVTLDDKLDPAKGDDSMAIEQQINVQELQRLNDAITVTMDAIRRVAPQLALLQQGQYSPFFPQQVPGISQFGQMPGYQQVTGGLGGGTQWAGGQVPFYGLGGLGTGMAGSLPWGQVPSYGLGTVPSPWSFGGISGTYPTIDPMTAAYVRAHIDALRNVLSQVPTVSMQFPQLGQQWPAQVSPFVSLGQRAF